MSRIIIFGIKIVKINIEKCNILAKIIDIMVKLAKIIEQRP